jgi:hypothetical protein
LALLAATLFAAANPRIGGRLAGTTGWQRFAGAVHLGLDRLRHHPGAACSVLVAGFAYQLVVVLTGLLAARALGLDVSLTAALAFMPAVAIAQVLPISLGASGVREGAFVLFLGPLGVPAASAVALGPPRLRSQPVREPSGRPRLRGRRPYPRPRSRRRPCALRPDPMTAVAPEVTSAAADDARRHLRWWREVLYVAAFYLVYSFVRNQFGSAAVSAETAYENARDVIGSSGPSASTWRRRSRRPSSGGGGSSRRGTSTTAPSTSW